MCLEYHARVEILLAFYSSWHSILFFTIEGRENRAKTAPFLSAWKKKKWKRTTNPFIISNDLSFKPIMHGWPNSSGGSVIFLKNWQCNLKNIGFHDVHSIVSTKNKISKSYFANTSPFDKHSYIKYQTLCRRNAKLCPYQFHVEFTHTGNYKSLFCGNPI